MESSSFFFNSRSFFCHDALVVFAIRGNFLVKLFKVMLLYDSEHRRIYSGPGLPPPFPTDDEMEGCSCLDFTIHKCDPDEVKKHVESVVIKPGDIATFGWAYTFAAVPDEPLFIFSLVTKVEIPNSPIAWQSYALLYDHDLSILSDRERDVLGVLGQGLGVKGVGSELAIESTTASTHIYNMRQKLELESTSQLIALACHYATTTNDSRKANLVIN